MKGIECFAYNKELALIATGGVDHVLRLWDPYVTSKPMAILKTHQTSIIDVMIYEPLQQVVSYSKDGVIMTWDIKDQSPLQHLSIKFPFTGTVLEHGGFPLCLTSHGSLFVTAEDCIAELKLTTAGAHRQNASHKGCVVAVYHIPHKNQIISASEFGDICTWSIDSGRKSSTIQTNPKSKEVLAFTIDKNAEFAVTGHIDGSGQLWNLISGKQEKTLAAYSDEEITNCIAFPNASIIFMLGWSKKILMYKNTNQYKKLTTLRPDTGWLSISSHKDDVISAAFWEPHFLATGTFDGDIFIWHIEHERLWRKIQIGRGQPLFQSLVNQYLMPPRTARSGRRREKQHQVLRVSDEERPPTNQQQKEHGEYTMPVDLLLYLGHRDHETYASLIATEGNRVNWWSTTAIGTPVASFTISEDTEKVITAITSDLDNRYVIVGTNQGEVSIWNIVTYGVYRRFADVVREGTPSTPKSTPLTETFRERPPCVHTWSCRSMDMIVSLCCFKRDKEMVAVGLETGCISLFALSGDYIGMFSQIEPWNLTESSERIQTKSPNIEEPQRELCTEKDEEEEEKVDLNIKNDVHNNEAENLVGEPADVQQSQSLPELGVSNRPPIPASTTGSVGGNTKDNTISNDVQKMKKTEYYQTISSINDDIVQQKAAWSLLGEKYNSNFKRRMQERLSRRRHFSDVTVASGDKPLLQHSGGLGNLCSPFQALSTKDCEDFVLPKGLPITSRMTAHSIDPYNGNSLEQMSSFGH